MVKKAIRKNDPVRQSADFWTRVTGTPLVYLVFLILTLLIYVQTWQFLLGKMDEENIILGPLKFLQEWKNLPEAFTRDAFLNEQGTFYRPLQTVSFMIDAHFFATKGSFFYFTNTVIHFLTCCSLFYLLTLFVPDRKGAFVFTLLYLATPLFVHSVAWAPARGDLLLGLTGILTLIFFIKLMNTGNFKYGVFSVVIFQVSILSKETAVVIPMLILLYYLIRRKKSNTRLIHVLIVFAGYFAAIVIYMILRSRVVTVPTPASEFSLFNIFQHWRSFPEYLAKFIIPVNLSPMPGYSLAPTAIGILLFAILTAGIVRFTPKPFLPEIFGLLWFIAITLPGAMYNHALGSAALDYLEHRAYLPMAGITLSIFLVYSGIQKENIKKMFFTGTIIFSVTLGLYAFIYTGNYKSPLEFYTRAIETNPASAVAYHNRGQFIGQYMDDQPGAISDFDMALKLKHDYATAFLNKGVSLYMMNDKAAAIVQYDSAIEYDPGLFLAHLNKANAKYELGFLEDALNEYVIANTINPLYAPSHAAQGMIFFKLKNYPAAITEFSISLQLDSGNAAVLTKRGLARFNNNDVEGACEDWLKAARLNDAEAQGLLGRYCKSRPG